MFKTLYSLILPKAVKPAFLLAAILSLSILTACSNDDGPEDDVIYDFNPVGLFIHIQDADGNNLLDPATKGNWFGQEFEADYDGKIYPAKWDLPWWLYPETRMYLPRFYGLTIMADYGFDDDDNLKFDMKDAFLYFGEFQGDKDHDISIDFQVPGSNHVYNIRMIHKFWWKKHEPQYDTKYYIDGTQTDKLTIILPARAD